MKREKEYWVPLYGWGKSHEISSWGQVRSLPRSFLKKDGKLNQYKGRVLKQYETGGGYLSVGLNFESKKRTVQVNILMGQSFYDPNYLKKGFVGNNKNGKKRDNYKNNIEIITHSGNMIHAHNNGLNKNYGETHYSAKLSDRDILSIRKLSRSGIAHKDIAAKYNIHKNYVGEVCRKEKRKRLSFKSRLSTP